MTITQNERVRKNEKNKAMSAIFCQNIPKGNTIENIIRLKYPENFKALAAMKALEG